MDDRKLHWPLVGRERELALFVNSLTDRRARGVVIYGASGVGKSRLAEEFLTQAARAGFSHGLATASALAGAVPLGAIAHLLPMGVDFSDPVAGFAAAVRTLSGPERRRWVLMIDDLQFLDATSAMLLRQLMDAGVVRLVGTVRSGESISDAVQTLTHGDQVQRVDLAELNKEQVEEVLQEALSGLVGRRTLHELFSSSGGNALYLRELVTGALDCGALEKSEGVWELTGSLPVGSARLTELVRKRLESAPLGGRSVLDLLALCGSLSLADAQGLTNFDILVDLEESGLIRIDQVGRRTSLNLSHPLYGEVLRAEISPLRRRAMLLAQAERVVTYGARRPEDTLHIASWQLAASGTADPALLIQAATLARHSHDYPRVVSLLNAIPREFHTSSTLLLLGESLSSLGKFDEAEETLATATSQSVEHTEQLNIVRARTFNLYMADRITEAVELNEAIAREVTRPSCARMMKINEGSIRTISGSPIEGMALMGRYLEEGEFDTTIDSDVWLFGASSKALGLASMGRTSEALNLAEAAYKKHITVDDATIHLHPSAQLIAMVVSLTEAGRLPDAQKLGEDGISLSVACQAPIPQLWLTLFLGRNELIAGHAKVANGLFREAVSLARAHHAELAISLGESGIAASAALLGDATSLSAASRSIYVAGGLHKWEFGLGRAWVAALQGRTAKARQILTDSADGARRDGHIASEALLLTDLARLGGAKNVAARLGEIAEQCDGHLAPARAHFAFALANDDPKALMVAAEKLGSIGVDLVAAEAAGAAAAAWARAGEKRLAMAATQQARDYSARCGDAATPAMLIARSAPTLTNREREIALLAAKNSPSKDIAKDLVLSVRTVDNHLQRIYNKLGITTRNELADALGTRRSS
ncbi:AAA family ATPase [Streptomyces sp. NPDC059534]|uniref:helix-turn-helix transcriptional regulator n=1 Tax=Streptomyces sp. NPDC059534 TaxID=3346859 RepID=UPI0036A150B0